MKKRRVVTSRKKQDPNKTKKRLRKMQRRFFEALDLPEELVPGMVKATLYGREDLFIENHRGVLEYTGERARIVTEMGILLVMGQDLTLLELGAERICIRGRLSGFLYEGSV